MLGIGILLIAIPLALIIGGIVAFIMLPVKAGIAVAVLAFLAAAAVTTWFINSIDLSH